MKSILSSWPYKWFGIWKEYGDSYRNLYSINDFIDKEEVSKYNMKSIANYLKLCNEISTTSRFSFPDPITKEIIPGSISFRTDGVWLWLDDLPEYIEKYNVALPLNFLGRIIERNYEPITNWSGNIEELDWPVLPGSEH